LLWRRGGGGGRNWRNNPQFYGAGFQPPFNHRQNFFQHPYLHRETTIRELLQQSTLGSHRRRSNSEPGQPGKSKGGAASIAERDGEFESGPGGAASSEERGDKFKSGPESELGGICRAYLCNQFNSVGFGDGGGATISNLNSVCSRCREKGMILRVARQIYSVFSTIKPPISLPTARGLNRGSQ
jgi:hypothetical protein